MPRRRTRSRRTVFAVLGGVLVVLAGAAGAAALIIDDDGDHQVASAGSSTTEAGAADDTAPPEPSTTTTPPATAPSTTSTTIDPADPLADPAATIRPGDEGPAVLALQHRLVELGYWMPEPDGTYGSGTSHAVTAFQKVEGLDRDGVAGPATRAALAAASRPTPADTSVPGRLLEVDLTRQVTFVVTDGAVDHVLDISSGKASTPTHVGTFTIERQIDGLRISDLGRLWRPKYFDGGIAFHGAPSVPPYPASHGCVRLPNASIDWMWASGVAPVGTPVHVY